MNKKEKFTLKILLQKYGVQEAASIFIVEELCNYQVDYKRAIATINDIIQVNTYFKDQRFSREDINNIIVKMLKKEIPAEKIIKIDQLFAKYNYSQEERGKIESMYFNMPSSKEILEKRLEFYKNFKLKSAVCDSPSHIARSIRKAYARIKYLATNFPNEPYSLSLLFSGDDVFKNAYEVETEILTQRYPLPTKYEIPKRRKYSKLTKQNKWVLSVLFQQMGLSPSQAMDLIDKLEEKRLNYDQIISAKESISDLINHFARNNYQSAHINSIIAATTGRISAAKVIDIDSIFTKYNYSSKDTETIEVKNILVFNHNIDLLDKKLLLFKDNSLQRAVVAYPRGLVHSLNLSYARIKHIKSKGKEPKACTNIIFKDEEVFREVFRISTKELIERYPITEAKYKVKK